MAVSRLPCQVCDRMLSPLKDGTSRPHTPGRAGTGGGEYHRCSGSGYRLARWEVGQRLHHHAGSVWVVMEDRRGHGYGGGDYLLECVIGTTRPGVVGGEEKGKTEVAHGEYMHRHGWLTPEGVAAYWGRTE